MTPPSTPPQPAANTLALAITYLPIDQLSPDPGNARQRSRAVERKLDKSIRAFGFVVPVLIDKDRKVIAGHGRLQAARRLGQQTVPVISLDHLNPDQAKALQIADNRLTELGEWDDKLLGQALLDLSLANLDFDLDATGFEMAEIDIRIEGLDEIEPEDEAEEPPLPTGLAVTQLGDQWLLGRHRLACANALEPESYVRLLEGWKVDLVATDMPFNVPIKGHAGGLGAIQHREFPMASGEMSEEEFKVFKTTVCTLAASALKPGGLAYMFMDWRHVADLILAGKGAFGELLNLCVWAKTAPRMGSMYRSQHELVAVFKKGGAAHCNNVQLGKFGRSRSNVWTHPGMVGAGRRTEEGDLLAMHPTLKPIQLVADIILDASARSEAVLDPFMGSGTTLLAAERTGRTAFGLELDGNYIDLAIRRWQNLTGGQAVLAGTGQTFSDIAAGGRR